MGCTCMRGYKGVQQEMNLLKYTETSVQRAQEPSTCLGSLGAGQPGTTRQGCGMIKTMS